MTNNFSSQHPTNARPYFFSLITLLLIITTDQILGLKVSDHILSNIPHNFLRDVFLINFTFMGDAIFAIGVIALLYFHWNKKDFAINLIASFITTTIFIQLLKNLFHVGNFTIFMEPGTTLINDETNSNTSVYFSPSMHAAIAFLMATGLVIQYKLSDFLQLSVLCTAIGIACSRSYLAHQHVSELMVGALVGSISAALVYYTRAGLINKLMYVLHKKSHKTNAGQMMPA
jgi:undecaprenyl-diphosphatase